MDSGKCSKLWFRFEWFVQDLSGNDRIQRLVCRIFSMGSVEVKSMSNIFKAEVIQLILCSNVTNICLNCCYHRCLLKELNILYATESFQLSSSV